MMKYNRRGFFALIFGIIAQRWLPKFYKKPQSIEQIRKLQNIYYRKKGLEKLAQTFRFRPIDPKDIPSYSFTYKAEEMKKMNLYKFKTKDVKSSWG